MSLEPGGVLHVVERCLGGVARYVEATMRRQRAAGRIGPVRLAADPAFLEAELAAAADAVLPYRSARGPGGAVLAARAVARIVRATAPAAVHLHSSYPGVYGRLFAGGRASDPAIVYCPHGWSFQMTTAWPKRATYRALERRLTRRADIVVSISETERRAALSAGLPAAGHVAIPHGLGPPRPGPTPAAMAAAMAADKLNLVFAGRIGAQKGLDLLLAALGRVERRDIALHVLGKVDAPASASYDFSDDRTRCHGWIAPGEIDAWLAAADAVVIPSRWEGFGLVAVEAMRNRTAVLASDRGSLPEILDGGRAGRLFDPEDAAGLARLIESLDRGELDRLAAAGHARWRAAYTADRADAALDAAYGLALERRRSRG